MNIKKLTLLVLALLLAGSAAARVEFALNEYPVVEFRALDQVTEACASPVASSFWCDHQNDTLMQIPTKGADFFFSDSGELFAVFAKPQKGQVINNHALNNNQNLIPLDDGSGIKVTVSRYFTPSGVCIHGTGIEPDVTVEMDEKYKNTPISQVPKEEDTQLKRAIESLRRIIGS